MVVVGTKDLGKSYGRVRALEGVSLEIGEGVTGLLGPNGAGKSTLLLCVLGLLPDWTGEVRVLGLDARRERRDLRRRVGFMPEADVRVPEMSGIRAARFLGRLSGLPYAEALRRAHEALWHVGLGEAVYRELAEYSVGMRQRFKLAQALVHDPELLFLDEPLAGLDPAGRDELLRLVRDLADDHGKHVVWSSHILPEVQKVADGIVILHEGRFRGSFRLEELVAHANRFLVEVEGPTDRFRTALREHRIEVGERPAARAAGSELRGRQALVATLPQGKGVHDLLRLARGAEVRVRQVSPIRDDLETVFHRVLDGEEAAP